MRSAPILTLAPAAILAASAAAQLAPPAASPPKAPAAATAKSTSGFDTDEPVDVSSDHAELQNRADRAVLTGNVRIRQGDLGLDAPRVNIAYTKPPGGAGGDPQIQRLDASGGVLFTRPGESARSQYGIYDLNRRVVTMIGGVVLNRGDNVVHGQRLVYDLDSGHATVDGGAVASGPGVTATSAGRVTGRFTVPKRQDQAQSPASPSPARK